MADEIEGNTSFMAARSLTQPSTVLSDVALSSETKMPVGGVLPGDQRRSVKGEKALSQGWRSERKAEGGQRTHP